MIEKVLIAAIVGIMVAGMVKEYTKKQENFDFAGLTLTRPPPWWFPQRYDSRQWLTTYYPDQISNPVCLNNARGDPATLNFNSSSYRYWRF
jgi:hypothetical protein